MKKLRYKEAMFMVYDKRMMLADVALDVKSLARACAVPLAKAYLVARQCASAPCQVGDKLVAMTSVDDYVASARKARRAIHNDKKDKDEVK